MKQHDYRNSPLRNQEGSALIVSLVFLVVMTIIGIASMDTAVMENIMATNSQFQVTVSGWDLPGIQIRRYG